ncbi:MAG: BNR repeat-containing protein [Verrucomicrobiota bacterium]
MSATPSSRFLPAGPVSDRSRASQRLALPLFALTFTLTLPSLLCAAELAPAGGARLLKIADDAFAGSSVNVLANSQHTLLTHGDTQYAAFYAADSTVVLAKRALRGDTWTAHRTGFRGRTADAHDSIALGVDGDGFLHVAWDHHNNPLNYARSTAPGSLELGPREAMTGAHEDRVTYPAFLPLPGGDLLFFHRDGGSGRGNLVLNRYDTRARRWAQVHASLIDGEGARSAYPAYTVDPQGTLHLAWVWRATPDVATNQDLAYARSADGGVTWTAADGRPLAVPFTAANADYALRVGPNRSLMNPPSLAADAEGRPLIANYWTPAGSDIPQFHVLRHTGNAWRVTQVTARTTPFTLAGGGTKNPPISRAVLAVRAAADAGREAVLVYRDDERGGRIVAATCEDLRKTGWRFTALTEGSVGAWEPSQDPVAWDRTGELHLLVQPVVQRDGNDREAAAVPATPVYALFWNPFAP